MDGRGRRSGRSGTRARCADGGAPQQLAVVRLRGLEEITPEMLLAMAEGVRRALRLVGVINMQIELEAEDADF
ncbi:MAG: hypothetical protein ACRDF5_05290 [bacterium]